MLTMDNLLLPDHLKLGRNNFSHHTLCCDPVISLSIDLFVCKRMFRFSSL